MEQDDGVGVAVYDLPPESHVGIVIGSRDSLHQNILGELANALHRYSTAKLQLFGTLAGYLGNVVFTEKDVLEHQQALERKIDGGGNAKFQQALTFAIESTTGKPPVDKKNPLQNLSALQLAKVTTLVSASVDNYGLNCNAPDAVPRDYSGSTVALPMPMSGANAFGAHGTTGGSGSNRPLLTKSGKGGGGYGQPRDEVGGGYDQPRGKTSGGKGQPRGGGGKGQPRNDGVKGQPRGDGGKGNSRSNRFVANGGGEWGGGKLPTAEQRAASRERSIERRAAAVASHVQDLGNLKHYDEAARATDPFNNFKQLEACATKINLEFKGLDKKRYGNKFVEGPFKNRSDGKVKMPLEMSYGSLYEFTKKERGDMKVHCPTPLYVKAAAIMDAARLGPNGYLSSWGEAYSSLKELSKGTNWEKNTRDFANSLRPGSIPML